MGSNLGSSSFFVTESSNYEMRRENDPSARNDPLRDGLVKTSGSGEERWKNRQGNVEWFREKIRFVSKKKRLNGQRRARNDMKRKIVNVLLSLHFYSINQCEI